VKKTKKKKSRKKLHKYRGIRFASQAEMEWAIYLDKLGIPWFYESEYLEWFPPPKKTVYTPDFIFPKKDGGKMFIEFKGYLRPKDRTKLRAIKKQYPDIDLRLVFLRANNKLTAKSKWTYAMWAEKNGFLWCERVLPQEWIDEIGFPEALDES